MMRRLFPQVYKPSVYAIPYERLMADGVKGLIFDIDNTLVPFDVSEPTPEVVALLRKLVSMGFGVCLLSNNRESRVAAFNIQLALPAVARAKKPGKAGASRALKLLGTKPGETAQIGDQLFTDVWCANGMGFLSILVKPVSRRDEWTVRLKRGVERLLWNEFERRVKSGQLRLRYDNEC